MDRRSFVLSLFGGIAGCGMIGQTVSNVKYGGRGRLSTLFAGALLLVLLDKTDADFSQVVVRERVVRRPRRPVVVRERVIVRRRPRRYRRPVVVRRRVIVR